jgi:hypothetical protein
LHRWQFERAWIVPNKTIIIIAAASFLLGCLSCWLFLDRYDFQSMGNGRLMRGDKWTGKAWITDGSWVPVPEPAR